jgi:hypothetical protein
MFCLHLRTLSIKIYNQNIPINSIGISERGLIEKQITYPSGLGVNIGAIVTQYTTGQGRNISLIVLWRFVPLPALIDTLLEHLAEKVAS